MKSSLNAIIIIINVVKENVTLIHILAKKYTTPRTFLIVKVIVVTRECLKGN